jgi:outer membrane protein
MPETHRVPLLRPAAARFARAARAFSISQSGWHGVKSYAATTGRPSPRLSGLVVYAAALFCLAPAVAQADEHIAVVKSDQILKESSPAKGLSAQIDDMFRKRGADLQARVNKFQSDASNFDKSSASLTADERASRQARLQSADMALQRDRRNFADDLTQCQNQAYQVVLGMANRAIEQVAKQGNYDLIVEEGVYFNPRIDITDKVLTVLSAQPAPPLPDVCKPRSSK